MTAAGTAGKVAGKEAEHVIAKAVEKAGVRDAEKVAAGEVERTAEKRVAQTVSHDYRAVFFKEHPELRGKVVVHHAVEQQAARRYPGEMTQAEMHRLENLRGIPKDSNGDLHLSRIRKEWNRFYKQHPTATREQLEAYRKTIDDKFGSEFLPPW
jgi:hypothetical protein